MNANRLKINLAMAKACMNATDIAEKASMSVNTVKNVVYGKPCKPRTLGKVARALNVDVSEIVEEE